MRVQINQMFESRHSAWTENGGERVTTTRPRRLFARWLEAREERGDAV